MFSENKKTKVDQSKTSSTSVQNLIAKGTKIVGSFISEGDIRIDGYVEGDVKTPGKVVVGKTGEINGSLQSGNAYVEGKFSGKLNLTGTLTLKASAVIEGEVVTEKLAVDPGATFNVSCVMKSTTKSDSKPKQLK
ncbi:polymer-forming cytoskeletal protein [uncultured Lacinutrix sp.]|uniref:bactofilin family protein n=1 Tax=uncultured Lacinutrix sp. TaxID=574032 RepID=UPI002626F4F2|nr:polymer-forming cytoskeletal protein [uncultured Lacinutrix sp.]